MYPQPSSPIARELTDFWNQTQSSFQAWWTDADLDMKMLSGQQDFWNNFYTPNNRNQKLLMFNKLLRMYNLIGGYQRDNRLRTNIAAADNDPDSGETADQRSTVLNWVMEQDGTYPKISDTFEGALGVGLNLLGVYMDYRNDPESGDIGTCRIPFNAVIMDNAWTKQDLSDCDRIWTRKFMTKRQVLSIFPKLSGEIPALGKGYANQDGKFQYLAQNWQYQQTDMYAYDEYFVRTTRKQRRLVDEATGEYTDWSGSKEQLDMMRLFNPKIRVITYDIPTVHRYCLVNNHLVFDEVAPYGLDTFPFACFLCYHFPEVQNFSWRYQGIIRNARDSQIELNRRRNTMLDIMDAQTQSGLMVKEDALVNPEDAFLRGPGRNLFFKNTANLASDVVPIPAPPVPNGWMQLCEQFDKEMMEIVGINEAMFGQIQAKDTSGLMMKLQQGAGLMSLRGIFDRLDVAQNHLGSLMTKMIMKNFTEEKVAKILGAPPTRNFFDEDNFRYTCQVQEAELTATQRQLQFMQALQLKQLGIAVPDDYIISKSTLSGKKDLMESIKKSQEMASQQAQAMQQAELKEQQVLSTALLSKAESDKASAMERQTNAYLNLARAKEEQSMAIYDRARAAAENAKALKEIEEIDENRLHKLARNIAELQRFEKDIAEKEEEKIESQMISS